jgi:hypothetical protein
MQHRRSGAQLLAHRQFGDDPVGGGMGELDAHQFGKGQHLRFDFRQRVHLTPPSWT